MSERWYQKYVQLAFHIDKALRTFTDNPFVDAYYGPVEWKAAAENEALAPELVRAAMELADEIPLQGFEATHAAYLAKQVRAIETLARRLTGETFSLEDEVQRCFDITPAWVPETYFEEAHRILDEALPGNGSIFERQQARRKRYELPYEKAHLLPELLRRTMDEVRLRASLFVELPGQETMDIHIVKDKHYEGACWYQGQYRSRIDINTDLPTHLYSLPDLAAHEGYPGHHTEAILKEQHLYHDLGYIDQAIVLLMSPHCLVSEGIATLAQHMIFAPGEVDAWLAEHVYAEAGIEPDGVDSAQLLRANELLEGVWGNAAFLLRQGMPDAEVMRYMQKYMLISDEEAPKCLEFLKVPFQETYVFTYFYGKQLMEPWVQGPDRLQVFRRFLMGEITPTNLLRQG